MKHPDFGGVLRIAKLSSSGVKGLLRNTRVQILANILGYITAHLWGASAVLT
jgi:hypothetical protein